VVNPSPLTERLHRLGLEHCQVAAMQLPLPRNLVSLSPPVPSLAPFFNSSALRSSRVTGLLRYYGLC